MKPVPLSPEEQVEAEIQLLTGVTEKGAKAVRRLLLSSLAEGSATEWTVDTLIEIGRVKKTLGYDIRKQLSKAQVIRETRPYFPGSETEDAISARYMFERSFISQTRFRVPDLHLEPEYLSFKTKQKVQHPPKVQKRSAPAACSGEGEKVSHGKKTNPEVEAMALRIEALPGTVKIEPAALRGMLHKHSTTTLDLDQAIADVHAVVPARRRTKPDTDERLLVMGYLSKETVRLGVSDQAAKIRAQEMRETAAATTGIPIVDAAERLAATFRIRAKNFPSKILPEVLADPVRAEMLVHEGRERDRNSSRPMESSEAFAYRAMTMPSEWAKVKDSPKVDARIAERSQALQKVVREGYLRCGISDIPSSHVVRLLQDWAVLDVSHDHKRIAASALLLAAEESLGTDADRMKQELTERLCSEGETMGSHVWNYLWMSRWYPLVASRVSWLPTESQERVSKRREEESKRQRKADETNAAWDARISTIHTLPSEEQSWMRLWNALREALGKDDSRWVDEYAQMTYRRSLGEFIVVYSASGDLCDQSGSFSTARRISGVNLRVTADISVAEAAKRREEVVEEQRRRQEEIAQKNEEWRAAQRAKLAQKKPKVAPIVSTWEDGWDSLSASA